MITFHKTENLILSFVCTAFCVNSLFIMTNNFNFDTFPFFTGIIFKIWLVIIPVLFTAFCIFWFTISVLELLNLLYERVDKK